MDLDWLDRLRHWWERQRQRRRDDLDPGCEVLDGPTTDDAELPYVVLFASALGLSGRRRASRIIYLAQAYRALFPPDPDDGEERMTDPDLDGYPGGGAT